MHMPQQLEVRTPALWCSLILTGFGLAVSNAKVTITQENKDPREVLRNLRGVIRLSILTS